MTTHVFACLVHERPEVVADLVRNLRAFERYSTILLYDGSRTGQMADAQLSAGGNVVVHPASKPMRWGRLHDFALDSMRFALQELDFDALTIVDSDQLLIRRGYGERVAAFLSEHPTVGMLGNAPGVQPRNSTIDPVRVAWREAGMWRAFLDRMPGGIAAFPHWTFWPSTVFTRHAAADLVTLSEDVELQALLRHTRMFATEEVVLPTLVAALGYDIATHPASFEFVRYRVGYDVTDVEQALALTDAYWMHPVPRRMDDPVRGRIRALAASEPLLRDAGRVTRRTIVDFASISGGVDQPSLLLLADSLRAARAGGARAGTPRIASPDTSSPLAIAGGEILAALGSAAPVATFTDRPTDSIDLALLDDGHGLIDLAVSIDAALARLRPGGSLYVLARSVPVAKVVAMVSAAAAGASARVRQAGRAIVATVPDGAAPVRPVLPLADLRSAVERSVGIDGWFEPDEAALLAMVAAGVLSATSSGTLVELGSFCGRATTVLGSVARRVGDATVYAVDRFDGRVGEVGRLYSCGPTFERFQAAIAGAGLGATVRQVVGAPSEVEWTRPIGLLLVDGLHDHLTVAADFRHYEPWLEPNAFVAFHDYGTYVGVTRFVDELLRGGGYIETARLGTLIVIRPRGAGVAAARARPMPSAGPALKDPVNGGATRRRRSRRVALPASARNAEQPLVSCLMPTFNRRAHVPAAIARFLVQDYPNRELIVVDDGTDPIGDLMPIDERVRYVHLPGRQTIGAKRNLAAELAAGEVLANWDDDDWVASWRLSYEVHGLLRSDADVVGLNTLLYYEPESGRAWHYAYPRSDAPWVHDPTLCLRRSTWEAERFPDTNYGLDTAYLTRGRHKRVTALEDERFYVGMIHSGNTSRKDTRGGRWRPTHADEILALMAADERSITPGSSPRGSPN